MSRLAATFLLFLVQQALARERRLVALPPLISQLFFVIVVLVAVPPPPQPPLVPELHRDGGRGGAAADAQRDGEAAAQRAEELLRALARQRAGAVAQRQGVQGGDPEKGPRLHLQPGGREPQTAVQEGQTSSQTGRAESQAGAAPQLMQERATGRDNAGGRGWIREETLYKDRGLGGEKGWRVMLKRAHKV